MIKEGEPIEIEMPPREDPEVEGDTVEERIESLKKIFEKCKRGEYDGRVYIEDLVEWCECDSPLHGYYHTNFDEWCPLCGVPSKHAHCNRCNDTCQVS